MVVELGEEALYAVDGLLEQGGLAGREAEGRPLHRLGEGSAVVELFQEREDELAHDAVHLLRGLVLEAAPAQFGAGDRSPVGVLVGFGENMVERSAEGLFHPLGLELLLVEGPDEHEIGELADDLEGIGDAALPHLLPDGVYLSLGCSGNQ